MSPAEPVRRRRGPGGESKAAVRGGAGTADRTRQSSSQGPRRNRTGSARRESPVVRSGPPHRRLVDAEGLCEVEPPEPLKQIAGEDDLGVVCWIALLPCRPPDAGQPARSGLTGSTDERSRFGSPARPGGLGKRGCATGGAAPCSIPSLCAPPGTSSGAAVSCGSWRPRGFFVHPRETGRGGVPSAGIGAVRAPTRRSFGFRGAGRLGLPEIGRP